MHLLSVIEKSAYYTLEGLFVRPGARPTQCLCTRVLKFIFEVLILIEIMVVYSNATRTHVQCIQILQVHVSIFSV